jgi:D-xylose transport system ATP-binding protein
VSDEVRMPADVHPSTGQAPALLRVRGMIRRFGAVEALAGVDLDVHTHEVVALVGDNAAGKSTLAKVIAGVLTPDGGTIELAGERVSLTSAAQAHGLGVATVFQDLALCDNLDVTANIFLGRELRTRMGRLREEEMAETARRLLRDLSVGVPSVRTLAGDLSAGQRQAVAIARSMVSEPRLVVLDEPTASLSVVQTAEVLTLIERLRDRGLGVVLISHNMTDVRAVADRVEVLRHGRNNGSFDAGTSAETIIAAVTGATMLHRPPLRSVG